MEISYEGLRRICVSAQEWKDNGDCFSVSLNGSEVVFFVTVMGLGLILGAGIECVLKVFVLLGVWACCMFHVLSGLGLA